MNDYGQETEIQILPSRLRGGEEEAATVSDGNWDERLQSDRSEVGDKRLETRRRNRPGQYNVTKRSQRGTTSGGILYRLIRDAEDRLAQLQAEITRVQETIEDYRYLEEELERKVEKNPRNPEEPDGTDNPQDESE